MREVLEAIIQAINAGDSGRAAAIAAAALARVEQIPELFVSPDYEICELRGGEAKQLVRDAIAFYRNHGSEIALTEFANPLGQFKKGELYIYAIDSNGRILAHPINQRYIGRDFLRVVDFDGKPFIREIISTANAQGSGWVEYKWLNPATGRDEVKTVYFEKHNKAIICSGVYDH